MKQASISFNKGIHRTPSIGDSGDLSEAMNLIPNSGELQLINLPTKIGLGFSSSNDKLLYVHDVFGGTKKIDIFFNPTESNLYNISYGESDRESHSGESSLVGGEGLTKIGSIGNVLVLAYENETKYFLYGDNGYSSIGNGTFKLDLAFGVSTKWELNANCNAISIYKSASNTALSRTYITLTTADISYYTGGINCVIERGENYRVRISGVKNNPGAKNYVILIRDSNNDSAYQKIIGYDDLSVNIIDFTAEINADRLEYFFAQFSLISIADDASITLEYEDVTSDVIYNENNLYFDATNDNKEAYYGQLNSFINEKTEEGKFIFPFFLRHAIRLKTGELVGISSPILIEPNTGVAPFSAFSPPTSTSVSKAYNVALFTGAYCGKLVFSTINPSQLTELKKYKDLIEGVVIGISEPIYQYKQADVSGQSLTYAIRVSSVAPPNKSYQSSGALNLPSSFTANRNFILTPSKSINYEELVTSASVFHIVKEVDLDYIENCDGNTIELDGELLKGVAGITQVIPDDTVNLSEYVPNCLYSYNNRLIKAGIKEKVFEGYSLNGMSGIVANPTQYQQYKINCEVSVQKNNYELKTRRGSEYYLNSNWRWLYYPNRNANHIVIYESAESKKTIPLKPHPFLNGSYALLCDNAKTETGSYSTLLNAESHNPEYIDERRVLVSHANSPLVIEEELYLPSAVMALSTATKALSQGQFGQFPLYAFCKDGIWALEVSSTGTISSKQPISRDICSSPDTICQLDDSIAFITESGLKVLSGGNTQLISLPIHGKNIDESSFLNDLPEAFTMLNSKTGNVYNIADGKDFVHQIQSASALCYDYVNQYIHVYIDGQTWHYVYSRTSGEWSKSINAYLSSPSVNNVAVSACVPGYPYTTLQFGKYLFKYAPIDLSTVGNTEAYLLTRSYAFGDPFCRKALYDLRMYGQEEDGSTRKVIVYISNDNKRWHKLTSLKALSAKYYRFLVYGSIKAMDTITGLVLKYEERYNHKLR